VPYGAFSRPGSFLIVACDAILFPLIIADALTGALYNYPRQVSVKLMDWNEALSRIMKELEFSSTSLPAWKLGDELTIILARS
jgi:hypothetical protein